MGWPSGSLGFTGDCGGYHTAACAKMTLHCGSARSTFWKGIPLSGETVQSWSYCGTRFLRRAQSAPLLETLPAKHWASLRWPEGNCCFLAALRAGRLRLCSHLPAATTAFGPLCFAALTSFRFVLEALVREKHLFPGRKYKLGTALRTLQHLVMEFHLPLPPCPASIRGRAQSAR